jgi:hypothetical protein
MAEEKKEESKIESAPAETAAPQAAASAPEKPKQEEKPKKEKPANCADCNKSLRNKRWYYRNGKFFCTKRCWRTTAKKEEKPKEAKLE